VSLMAQARRGFETTINECLELAKKEDTGKTAP
jgi:hypothetical protein